MPENMPESPAFSNSHNPSMDKDALTDTLAFVKNLWGNMHVPGLNNVPGMVMPTLSVEDLDKKIQDLKTVESWLSVNMSMLRGSIQTLEVQRATIATLQSMSASLASAIKQTSPYQESAPQPARTETADPSPEKTAAADQSDANTQFINPAAWWDVLQDQFKAVLSTVAMADAADKVNTSESDSAKVAEPQSKAVKKPVKTPMKRTASKKPEN